MVDLGQSSLVFIFNCELILYIVPVTSGLGVIWIRISVLGLDELRMGFSGHNVRKKYCLKCQDHTLEYLKDLYNSRIYLLPKDAEIKVALWIISCRSIW